MIKVIEEVLHHSLYDTINMLPFLFVAFLLIEVMEHYSVNIVERAFQKAGKAGPIIGALAGCFPQCGFSVMAANFYAGGIISVGTLIATFVATSDEAILIIAGNPGRTKEIILLLFCKVIIGITAGYMANILCAENVLIKKVSSVSCTNHGCHTQNARIIRTAMKHTVRIYTYLLFFTVVLNLIIEFAGVERLSEILLSNTMFQPVIAALIGLVPNCAASVILTQLYLNGTLSFASIIAGLCAGAGAGLIVLFKVNENRKDNLKITGILYGMATIAGIVLEILSMI